MASDNIEIEGLVKQREELDRLMMGNPVMEKRVQALIRKVLLAARKEISQAATREMKTDPRQAYKAVKSAIYRRILGGSISILNKKRAGKRLAEPPVVHKLETQTNRKGNHRGGNRRKRSERTIDLLTYDGPDRGFILRFLNAGTKGRTSRIGNRGSITARNFFANSSQKAMQQAAETLINLIDELIKKEIK